MGRLLGRTSVLGIAILLLALGAVAAVFLQQPVAAQTEPDNQIENEPARVIQVTGHGEVRARPDIAVVRVGVETEAEAATEALDENNVRMGDVISATVAAGIPEEDIQTQVLQLNPIFSDPGQAGGTPTITGYRARNVVEVTVRDLEAVGELLDAVVEVGGNTIEEIRFEVSDMEELRAQAREAAMNNAREKAEQLTALADAELGEVLMISESGITPPPRPFAGEEAAAADQAVPIAPGMQTIETNIQVSWRIR